MHGLILTGTRGSGKTAVAACLRDAFRQPTGVTTRPPRADDRDAYRYLSPAEFAALEARGELVISSRYAGQRYGVTRRELAGVREGRHRPLLTLTPEAALRLAAEPGWTAVFLDAPDGLLDRRLAERGAGEHGVQRRADRDLRRHFCVVWNDGPLSRAVEAVRRTWEAADEQQAPGPPVGADQHQRS